MGLTCNIDAKGKSIRLMYGLVLTLAGLITLFAWALRGGGPVAWIITVAAIVCGAFAIFEARAGWCVMRAMGFKTPY